MIESAALRLSDPSGAAEARRFAVGLARGLGWNDVDCGQVAIVATELATNLVRYARDGVMSMTAEKLAHGGRLSLVSVDRGPGMDVSRCVQDGYSTSGSRGTGLGAVSRLADTLDIVSAPEGSVLTASLCRPRGVLEGARVRFGACSIAKDGETVNGDAWDYRIVGGLVGVVVCDGLGHGPYAHEASARAVEAFRRKAWRTAEEAMTALDEDLKPTRGAAAAVAVIDPLVGKVRYCGVGNIAARIVAQGRVRHLMSHNGILGHASPRKTELEYELPPSGMLLLHTDGLQSRWRPHALDALESRDPALVAGVLYRDYARGNDDAAVVVAKRQ
ncbi:MAG TPA: SpoIIE family protein phosphatase [Gammaproteobacteria bacterium]|nr:SpoIIE family protein phosphatase [Gammaproteobacteria bacterium]